MKKYISHLLLICMAAFAGHSPAAEQAAMADIVKRRMSRAALVPDALQNPGFEDAESAVKLPGWTAVVHAGNSYRIEPDQSQSFSGKRSLVIENTGKPEWGGVTQVFRAEGMAGREVELSVHLKMEGVTVPGFYMMMKIMQMGRELKIAKTQDQFVGDGEWKVISLRALLPKETTHIEVMLTLQGDGRAWVDDVRVVPLAESK